MKCLCCVILVQGIFKFSCVWAGLPEASVIIPILNCNGLQDCQHVIQWPAPVYRMIALYYTDHYGWVTCHQSETMLFLHISESMIQQGEVPHRNAHNASIHCWLLVQSLLSNHKRAIRHPCQRNGSDKWPIPSYT